MSLTADGGAGNALDTANGNVNVSGTIDASGKAGGAIALYGRSGVDVEGTLLARGSDSKQRGGRVDIGTSGVFDPSVADPYNATYGYENIDPSRAGLIRVGANALIDVSGGTAGGLSGGTVNFRAPLLSNGTVNVALPSSGFAAGKGIAGSRATTLEAYATWSTTDATTGAKHFDGIVDPAGWYDASGHLLAGTFTAQSTSSTPTTFTFTPDGSGGGTVKNNTTGATSTVTQAQLQSGSNTIGFGGLQSMFFAPVSGGSNTDHQTFYGYQDGNATTAAPGTLMGFVQHGLDALKNPFDGTGIANARIVPGIELDNPSAAINGGNIEVLTNWNLGAGRRRQIRRSGSMGRRRSLRCGRRMTLMSGRVCRMDFSRSRIRRVRVFRSTCLRRRHMRCKTVCCWGRRITTTSGITSTRDYRRLRRGHITSPRVTPRRLDSTTVSTARI